MKNSSQFYFISQKTNYVYSESGIFLLVFNFTSSYCVLQLISKLVLFVKTLWVFYIPIFLRFIILIFPISLYLFNFKLGTSEIKLRINTLGWRLNNSKLEWLMSLFISIPAFSSQEETESQKRESLLLYIGRLSCEFWYKRMARKHEVNMAWFFRKEEARIIVRRFLHAMNASNAPCHTGNESIFLEV